MPCNPHANAAFLHLADSFWSLETDEVSGDKYVLITLAKKSMGFNSWEMLLESERVDAVVTDRVGERASMHAMHRKSKAGLRAHNLNA